MSLLNDREFEDIKKYFQLWAGGLTKEDKKILRHKIEPGRAIKVAMGGGYKQKRELIKYGFYDKLITTHHPYLHRIVETIENNEKAEFDKNRPPGTTNKILKRKLGNITLSFLAAYYQSDREFWIKDKVITKDDLTGIAAAIRAQILLCNRVTINRSRMILKAAKKFYNIVRCQILNCDGFSAEAINEAQRIIVILDGLRTATNENPFRYKPIPSIQQQPESQSDNEEDELMEEDEDEFMDENECEQRKQMTYAELVRKFSMQNERVQRTYLKAKAKLEIKFDASQFVVCRNCLAYQFLLSNSARSEVLSYLQWKEIDKAMRVKIEGQHPEDDFIMVPFYDHKNCGRGIHARKPLWMGMDRWMLNELLFLRGFCVPEERFVFSSGQSYKYACRRGMTGANLVVWISKTSRHEYKDHLHWIRSSATNASCISTEQSTSQMMPDMDLVILNGHSLQTAQKHYMRLENKERCIIAARAYVKLSHKRRTAFDDPDS